MTVYSYPINKVAHHCIHHTLANLERLQEILHCDLLITIGYVDYLGKSNYLHDETVILSWIKSSPQQLTSREIHVWLTLPTLEIIDPTIIASFLHVNSNILGPDVKDYRNLIFGRPDDLSGENCIIHKPQFVGLEFLNNIGALAYTF